MNAWALYHYLGGRNEHEPDETMVDLFTTPEAALRHVRSVHPSAPDWTRTTLGGLESWIEPFVESDDADRPCRGEWWSLHSMTVRR